MSNTAMTSAQAPQKKNVGARIFSIVILLVCAGFFFLPIKTFVGVWEGNAFPIAKQSLFNSLLDIFSVKGKVLGCIPSYFNGGTLGTFLTLALYAFMLALIVAAILCIVAIFTKKAPTLIRIAVYLMTLGAAVYSIALLTITLYLPGIKAVFDIFTLLLTGVGALIYLLLMFTKLGNKAWVAIVHFLLTLCVSGLLLFAMTDDSKAMVLVMKGASYGWLMLAIALYAIIHLALAAWCAMFVQNVGFNTARYIVQVIVTIIACLVAYVMKIAEGTFLLYAVIATVIAALQLILVSGQLVRRGKQKVQAKADAAMAEFNTEEYIEAYAYDGGPVAGVEMAKEVYPTVAAIDAAKDPDGSARNTVASLLGNGFDPFLITLNEKQKEEFIDLYVLKCRGVMPEIPGYVVGGDNKQFFNNVFIYLGQYREKIPADLLDKMYKFSMKL